MRIHVGNIRVCRILILNNWKKWVFSTFLAWALRVALWEHPRPSPWAHAGIRIGVRPSAWLWAPSWRRCRGTSQAVWRLRAPHHTGGSNTLKAIKKFLSPQALTQQTQGTSTHKRHLKRWLSLSLQTMALRNESFLFLWKAET